jgi:hypothetical protein
VRGEGIGWRVKSGERKGERIREKRGDRVV